jgi:hypothetical protein
MPCLPHLHPSPYCRFQVFLYHHILVFADPDKVIDWLAKLAPVKPVKAIDAIPLTGVALCNLDATTGDSCI